MTASIRGYRKEWLRVNLLAGLTTSAVVIPKAMAFALVAGLPAAAGLYVAFIPMLVYALLGTSRQLSVSSTTTLSILTASSLAQAVPVGEPERMLAAAATLAALTGVFLLAAGVCRLGFLANFLSDPVLTGFKAGIGLVIVADQLPKLLGVHIDKGGFAAELLVLRTEGRMNFASAPRVGEHMWSLLAESRPRVVVLECSAVPDIEYTALRSLTAGAEKLKSSEIELWLAGLNPAVRRVVERSPLASQVGPARIFPDLRSAVAAFESGRTTA